jgi:hypothetical protein
MKLREIEFISLFVVNCRHFHENIYVEKLY